MYTGAPKQPLLGMKRQLKKTLMRSLGLRSGRQWDKWRKANKGAWDQLQRGEV